MDIDFGSVISLLTIYLRFEKDMMKFSYSIFLNGVRMEVKWMSLNRDWLNKLGYIYKIEFVADSSNGIKIHMHW